MQIVFIREFWWKDSWFFDYNQLYSKFLEHTLPYVREGKIVYMEEENEGIESGPGALERLFTGQITGKGIIVVARD